MTDTIVDQLNTSLSLLADTVGDLREGQTRLEKSVDQLRERVHGQTINVSHARLATPMVISTPTLITPTGTDRARHGMSIHSNVMVIGLSHLIQSINDILTTPIGSRVMRREYGSKLPDLIDQPMNAAGKARLYMAIAKAIAQWEPRVLLRSMQFDVSQLMHGSLKITLTWVLRPAYRWMLAYGEKPEQQQVVRL